MRVCGAVICNCKVVNSNSTGEEDLYMGTWTWPKLDVLLYKKERSRRALFFGVLREVLRSRQALDVQRPQEADCGSSPTTGLWHFRGFNEC